MLFGWETNNGGPEVLTYGLGRDYLLAHPDIAQWPLEKYLARVKAAGGFCCHAHPFREAYYIVPFQPQPQLFEAFEVFNNHHAPENRIWDQKALAMAQKYHLIQLAGCDAHRAQEVTGGAVKLPWPVSDMPGSSPPCAAAKRRLFHTYDRDSQTSEGEKALAHPGRSGLPGRCRRTDPHGPGLPHHPPGV